MMKNIKVIVSVGCLFFSLRGYAQNIGVNTTGAAPAATNLFEVLQPSTTANTVGVYVSHSGAVAGAGNYGYALQAIKSGAGLNNIAAYLSSTGGTNNYALIVPVSSGYVGIGTSAPTTLFHIDGGTPSTTQTIATISGNSLTSGTGLAITSSSLTSGTGLSITASNAATTGNLLYVTSNSTGAISNGLARFNFTGAHTGNGVQIDDNTTTGNGLASTLSNSTATGSAIKADATVANSANAIYAVTNGAPNYSAIFAQSTPASAGTGFTSATSNHTLLAQINGNQAYSYGIFGRVVNAPSPSAGVLGYYSSTAWGGLGYHNANGDWGLYTPYDAVIESKGAFGTTATLANISCFSRWATLTTNNSGAFVASSSAALGATDVIGGIVFTYTPGATQRTFGGYGRTDGSDADNRGLQGEFGTTNFGSLGLVDGGVLGVNSTVGAGSAGVTAQNQYSAASGTGSTISGSYGGVTGSADVDESGFGYYYHYGLMGEVWNSAASSTSNTGERCGGVLGSYYQNASLKTQGALGYHRYLDNGYYGGWFYSTLTSTSDRTGQGSGKKAEEVSLNIGMGAFGDQFGAIISATNNGIYVKGGSIGVLSEGPIVTDKYFAISKIENGETSYNFPITAKESTEQIAGNANLTNGESRIRITGLNDQSVIILTPYDNCQGLYVKKKDNNELVVGELNGGKSNGGFAYLVINKAPDHQEYSGLSEGMGELKNYKENIKRDSEEERLIGSKGIKKVKAIK